MRLCRSAGAWLVALWVVLIGALILLLTPPPWPCDWDAILAHPRARELDRAALEACETAAGDGYVTIDLRAVWPGPWERLELLGPYHGNLAVLTRVGPSFAVMACTRSRVADEWTQAVLVGSQGPLAWFDVSSAGLDGPNATIARAAPHLRLRCAAFPLDRAGSDGAP